MVGKAMVKARSCSMLCQTLPRHGSHFSAISNLTTKRWWTAEEAKRGISERHSCLKPPISISNRLEILYSEVGWSGWNLKASDSRVLRSFRQIPTGRNKQTWRTPGLVLMFFHLYMFISRQNCLAGNTGSSSSCAFPASLTGDNDLPIVLGSLAA